MVVSTTSSDDEENALKHLKKVRKKNHKICYMHLTAVRNEEVNDFTLPRWNTYRNCVQRWLCCHGEGQKVAETFKHCMLDLKMFPRTLGFTRLATGVSLTKGACILPRNGPNGWLDFKMHRGASLCHRTTLVRQAQQLTLREKNFDPRRACQ